MAFTKTFTMAVGAILSISLVPILMVFLLKGKVVDEEKNPINRFFIMIYRPILKLSLKLRYFVLILAVVLLGYSYFIYKKTNWEFMPMMNEQTLMYMPVTPYGIGIDFAKELLQKSDEVIKSFPEVKSAFGKAGRADTSTDPAPLAMIETIIELKDKSEWREGMSYKKLIQKMDKALQIPGLINSWTYPIRGRIDMLLTGIRTPLGIKIYGDDHKKLAEIAQKIEQKLQKYDKTLSVSSDKSNNGYYLQIDIDQDSLSRYGINKDKIFDAISLGVGAKEIAKLYKGLERYSIELKYRSNKREDIEAIKSIYIKTKLGYYPLSHFAKIRYKEDLSVIKSEKGMHVNFIYITPKAKVSSDEYKKEATKLLQEIKLPDGYYYEWAGDSEYLDNAMKKFMIIIPAVLIVLFFLIYLAFKDLLYAMIIFFSLPIALSGGILFVDFLHINMSVAVVVGFIALLGIATETAIVMLIYLDEALNEDKNRQKSFKELVIDGASLRLRPKLMTLFAIVGSLVPILFINSVGYEVMRAIAVPMIGGLISSSFLTLIVIPILFYIFKRRDYEKV